MAVLAGALAAVSAGLSADVAAHWGLPTHLADGRPLSSNSYRFAVPVGALGATGSLPHDTQLAPDITHDAGNPAALVAAVGPVANLPRGPLGLPAIVLDAYQHAQAVLAAQEPNCHLPWWLLAGIGKIESGQAENGMVDANGTTLRPILGPELNGSNGFAAIPATDGGKWTGDPVWSRAVGPMQFLPSTWVEYGGSGNPNNVYDAAIAAGRYLCASGRDLSDPAQQAVAVFSYNHSDSYVRIVLIWAHAYEAGVVPLPQTPVPAAPPAQQANLAANPLAGLPSFITTALTPTPTTTPTTTGSPSTTGTTPTGTTTGTPTTGTPTGGGTSSTSSSPTPTLTGSPTTSSSAPPSTVPSSAPSSSAPAPTCTTPTPTVTPTVTPTPAPGCPTPSPAAATDSAPAITPTSSAAPTS
jgi:hypothetical protein